MEDRLKKFVALVDAGTFTAAAVQLHTSQPALTTAMQKLAREIKADLFVTGSRSLVLTQAGQVAYVHGQQLLVAEKNLRTQLQFLEGQKQPLHVGCIDSIADVLVQAELLPVLEQDSQLSLTVQNSTHLIEELRKGKLDMAIVAEQPEPIATVEQRFLGNERFVLVCSQALQETYQKAFKQGRLVDFLAYNKSSTTFTLLRNQLLDNGVESAPRLYSTNPSVLLKLALQGRGVAALPLTMVKSYLGKDLTEITLRKPLFRPIITLWQTGHKLPDSVEDFLDATEVQLV